MKTVKIILVILTLGVIGFFVAKWSLDGSQKKEDEVGVVKPINEFRKKIEKSTDSLKKLPNTSFSKYYYDEVLAELKYFHEEEVLDPDDPNQNNQEFENLSEILLAAYVPEFVNQAFYKLSASRWDNTDLQFIKKEIQNIKGNEYFDETSPFILKFNRIENVISKYYQIANFINSFKYYPSNLNYSVDGRFPVADVGNKIDESKDWLRYCNIDPYLKNVTWLQEDLKAIPSKMYQKNYDYLKIQLQHNSGKYANGDYKSQPEYSRNIFDPLNKSLQTFNNKMYGIPTYPKFSNDIEELNNLLGADNDAAREYFKQLYEEQMKQSIQTP